MDSFFIEPIFLPIDPRRNSASPLIQPSIRGLQFLPHWLCFLPLARLTLQLPIANSPGAKTLRLLKTLFYDALLLSLASCFASDGCKTSLASGLHITNFFYLRIVRTVMTTPITII